MRKEDFNQFDSKPIKAFDDTFDRIRPDPVRDKYNLPPLKDPIKPVIGEVPPKIPFTLEMPSKNPFLDPLNAKYPPPPLKDPLEAMKFEKMRPKIPPLPLYDPFNKFGPDKLIMREELPPLKDPTEPINRLDALPGKLSPLGNPLDKFSIEPLFDKYQPLALKGPKSLKHFDDPFK